ncbi:UNVERIFIED_CONTAM: hypothetical protein PYX00_004468 [Menopon gallinae]|uniref:Dendritic cell-specific transmembrane protein-like domain-containing protein n=1 Tax=Menopon gallinae TaxID=328185 RepID=A0AAW2I3W6_9NEOP
MILEETKNWFIYTLLNALELRSELRYYKFEKRVAKAETGDDEFRDPINVLNFTSYRFQVQKRKILSSGKARIYRKLFSDGTTENFVMKSAFGFLGGLLLTYICYLFLIYSLNFTLRRATLICIGLGVILSLGLAFSVKIRCTVLLCIPQLFSKRGRQALLAYAFILALSGPAKNTLHNVEVMSESLACGQEQLKKAENELLKCVRRPNTAVKQPLESMLVKLDTAVKGYKRFIEDFYKECEAVLDSIIRAQEWIYSIHLLCNKKVGSPYSRCTDLLFQASENCKAVGTDQNWVSYCTLMGVQDWICATKNSPICTVEDLPPFWPSVINQKRLDDFMREAMDVLYVKVETHQTFTQPNRTATLHEEYQGMATEIRQKTDQFLQYFDVMSVIFGVFILVLFIKVIIYRYKFLTEDEYDNRFITSDFVDIDKTRAEFRMQTLLPLEPRERKKYIKVTSMRLVPYERTRLLSSFVFLIIATFKIIIHMLTDCSLYWMLSTMRKHGRMLLLSSDLDVPHLTVTVDGTGLFADLLRNITSIVKPYAVPQFLDPAPCLPDPISPDWNRYWQILTLVLICWMLAFCEPYGLRLRHMVMVTYHPDRARERAIWLYNRILTTRINYVKFARRQLRRKYKDADEAKFFRPRFLVMKPRLKCLLCREDLKDVDYVKCPTIGCVGIYCKLCFQTLQLCSICKDPSYYGDYSDESQEKDSEDDKVDTVIKCFNCGCEAPNRMLLRRKPVEDYYTFQMNYNPVPYMGAHGHPMFQLSVDALLDEDGMVPRQARDMPAGSPSILTKFMQQCKKACTAKKLLEEKAPEVKKKESKKQEVRSAYFVAVTDESTDMSGRSTQKSPKPKKTVRKSSKEDPKKSKTAIEEETVTASKNVPKQPKINNLFPFKGLGVFKWKLSENLPWEAKKKPQEPQPVKEEGEEKGLKIKEIFDVPLLKESEIREASNGTEESEIWAMSHIQSEDDDRSSKVIVLSATSSHSYSCPMRGSSHSFACPMRGKSCQNVTERDENCPVHGRQSSDEMIVPLVEKWRHPNFEIDTGECSKNLVNDELFNSPVEKLSEGDRGSLTDKETQTCRTSDVHTEFTADCPSVVIDIGGQASRRTSQEYVYTSSLSSSTYGAIRKELIDSRRRRQKSREELKTSLSERRLGTGGRRLRRCSTRYETTSDSSEEGKPLKPRRTRSRNPRMAITVNDGDVFLTNSAQKVLTKKVDMMRAKLAKFFKKSIKRQSSSDEGASTELENVDYLPSFMSDSDFRELSQKLDDNKSESNRKLCAPDLLSDLPSSKTPPEAIHDSQSEFDDGH